MVMSLSSIVVAHRFAKAFAYTWGMLDSATINRLYGEAGGDLHTLCDLIRSECEATFEPRILKCRPRNDEKLYPNLVLDESFDPAWYFSNAPTKSGANRGIYVYSGGDVRQVLRNSKNQIILASYSLFNGQTWCYVTRQARPEHLSDVEIAGDLAHTVKFVKVDYKKPITCLSCFGQLASKSTDPVSLKYILRWMQYNKEGILGEVRWVLKKISERYL